MDLAGEVKRAIGGYTADSKLDNDDTFASVDHSPQDYFVSLLSHFTALLSTVFYENDLADQNTTALYTISDVKLSINAQPTPTYILTTPFTGTVTSFTQEDLSLRNYTQMANFTQHVHSALLEVAGYTNAQKTAIIIAGTLLSVITTLGNLLVMLSFRIDKHLQIISNYFLFSLAVADLTIGIISCPLMTFYTVQGEWTLGYTVCQFWLCVDYLMSNASVWNLLLISLDRYFSVTKPLTYRPRRTTKKALIMIASTYILSVILWPPWIIAWPYIEGVWEVADNECVVQFLKTNPAVTIGTILAAFYIPVTIMMILYTKVYVAAQSRQTHLKQLQGFNRRQSRKWQKNAITLESPVKIPQQQQQQEQKRCSEATVDGISVGPDGNSVVYRPVSIRGPGRTIPEKCELTTFQVQTPEYKRKRRPWNNWLWRNWKMPASDKIRTQDRPEVFQDESSEITLDECSYLAGPNDPLFIDTYPGSLGDIHENQLTAQLAPLMREYNSHELLDQTPARNFAKRASAIPTVTGPNTIDPRRLSLDSGSYSVVITLPNSQNGGATKYQQSPVVLLNSIVAEPTAAILPQPPDRSLSPCSMLRRQSSADSALRQHHRGRQRQAQRRNMQNQRASGASCGLAEIPELSLGDDTTIISNRCAIEAKRSMSTLSHRNISARDFVLLPGVASRYRHNHRCRANRKSDKKQESKAAKTLSAILLAFVLTWAPYSIIICIEAFRKNTVPAAWFAFSYYLCYINSTVNPILYALCNPNFRKTYIRILTCKWRSPKRQEKKRQASVFGR